MSIQASQPTRRRKYTEQQRNEALSDAETMGTCAAAHKHELPASTVSRWRSERRSSTPKVESKPTTPKPSSQPTTPPQPTTTEAKPQGRLVAKHYTPSQKAQAVEYAHVHGVTAASKELGPSRHSIYAWLREAEAAAAGEPQASTTSPAPPTSDAVTEEQRDAEILGEYARHPGLGPSQIKNQLRRKGLLRNLWVPS